ncbi:MAG TPA: SCO family protein [Gemmatimonadaceae bacterium]|nr:SCO family protein [Gemmatimonadaceae bacterium]
MRVLRALSASLLILAAGVAVLAHATDGFSAYTTETARRLDVQRHPRAVPDVALQSTDGTEIRFDSLRGRWVLVDFIYTRCLTYCTILGTNFARLQTSLAKPIAEQKVALLSISFDPTHDGPAQLAAYQQRFGDSGTGWIAARPRSTAALDSLTHTFGITAIPDGYGGFVHNAAIDVVSPDGRLVAVLDWSDPAIAARFITAQLTP